MSVVLTREEAIKQLWQNAVNELVIIHPNPASEVSIQVLSVAPATVHGHQVDGHFTITNARDTSEPGKIFPIFNFSWRSHDWPGRVFVRSFVTASWATLLAHEGLEGVLYKNRYDGFVVPSTARVHDPHTTTVAVDHATTCVVNGRSDLLMAMIIGDVPRISEEQMEADIRRLIEDSNP